MVLKRFLTMALGALGLGALAAGTAVGQTAGDGNIPAPDIFDDQITCIMNVPSAKKTPTPTVIPMGGMTSDLDDLIGDGDMEIGALDGVDDLGYVIPAKIANCGAGGDAADAFNAVTVGEAGTGGMESDPDFEPDSTDYDPGEGDIATDVAHGYSELLGKFVAVYGKPEETSGGTARALEAAQERLSDAIEAGRTGASLTVLEGAVERAQTAHDKARAAFTDASAGPVYQAGVAEWMAKAVVTQSIEDYDEAVAEANNARGVDGSGGLLTPRTIGGGAIYVDGLDGLDYADYVPLGNDDLISAVFTAVELADGMIGSDELPAPAALQKYANADFATPSVATVSDGLDADGEDDGTEGVTTTTASNFDAAGRLIVPMVLFDHDGDGTDGSIPEEDRTPEILVPVTFAVTGTDAVNNNGHDDNFATGAAMVADVRTRRDRTETAAAALEELRDDNLNPAVADHIRRSRTASPGGGGLLRQRIYRHAGRYHESERGRR